MNIQQEEKALKTLSPQKYTIRILVIAVCFLASTVGSLWLVLNKDIKAKDKQLQECKAEKQQMSEQRRIEEKKEDMERVRRAEEDKRKADSILSIVVMTQSSIKKAIKNEKSK